MVKQKLLTKKSWARVYRNAAKVIEDGKEIFSCVAVYSFVLSEHWLTQRGTVEQRDAFRLVFGFPPDSILGRTGPEWDQHPDAFLNAVELARKEEGINSQDLRVWLLSMAAAVA